MIKGMLYALGTLLQHLHLLITQGHVVKHDEQMVHVSAAALEIDSVHNTVRLLQKIQGSFILFLLDEGVSTFIDYKGSVVDILEDLRGGMLSGLSYSGCRTIVGLQAKAQWTRQTTAGLSESKTHILGK